MKHKPNSFFSKIRNSFANIFGQLQWNSPPWLVKAKRSPKTFGAITTAVIALLLVSAYGIYCYKHRPQPVYVTASISIPEITANAETLVPNNLIIDFGIKQKDFITQAVAPIGAVGKNISEGIQITPKIAGIWSWNSDSQLIFVPEEDWQAGQKYTIDCAANFFAPQIPMESHRFSFVTKAFAAKINELKFYQDPTNANIRNAVATIEFNYPVNPDSLVNITSLRFQAIKNGKVDEHAPTVPFSYTYDAHNRIAYLHSENIQLSDEARYLLLTLNKNTSSATDSAHLKADEHKNLLIPDAKNFL